MTRVLSAALIEHNNSYDDHATAVSPLYLRDMNSHKKPKLSR